MLGFIENDKILYAVIIVACLVAVYIIVYNDFDQEKSIGEMYFLDYPSIISQNQSTDFSLLILNHGDISRNYVITVFLDNVKQKSTDITVGSDDQFTYADSISSLEIGSHRIKVELYDKDLSFTTHGSKLIPYYIFFNVDVI